MSRSVATFFGYILGITSEVIAFRMDLVIIIIAKPDSSAIGATDTLTRTWSDEAKITSSEIVDAGVDCVSRRWGSAFAYPKKPSL